MAIAVDDNDLIGSPQTGTFERKIGEVLLENGTLTQHDIERILTVQKQHQGEAFGDVALRLGIVTEREMRQALALQSKFPYALLGDSSLSPLLTSAYEPFGKRAEELRVLRSELILRWFGRGNRTLSVMQARSGDGSSALAANLAIVFAQLGERTLLIDANLRAPVQHDLFGIRADYGLVDFLNGRDRLGDALVPVPGFNTLSVFCAGLPPPNPQELLSRVAFEYMLQTISGSFDIVIVDAPPVLESADAQLLAARTRGALLVAKRHHTKLADMQRMREQLEPSGAVVLGAVIDED